MTFLIRTMLMGVLLSPAVRADELGDTVRQAIRMVEGSVVRLRVVGGEQSIEGETVTSQSTTGLVISGTGEILTSQFALEGQPQAVLAEDADGRDVSLTRVATDHVRRLVLLKASEGRWTPIPEQSDSEVRIGQWTIAAGRFFTSEQCNVSVGILSAVNRIHGMALQTDCKVSPVNYGGPLLNLDGHVLGILVPLSPRGQGRATSGVEWYDSGIGFAIPLADALRTADRLRSGRDLRPGRLGLSLKASNPYDPELIVRTVLRGGPADKAGLKPDDRILTAAGRQVNRAAVLEEVVARSYAGESLALEVQRAVQTLQLQVELVEQLPVPANGYLGIVPLLQGDGTPASGIPDPAALARMLQSRPNAEPEPPAATSPANAAEAKDTLPVVVVDDSPAARAGLSGRVELRRVNGSAMNSLRALQIAVADAEPGMRMEIEYQIEGSAEVRSVSFEAGAEPSVVPVLSEAVLSVFRGSAEAVTSDEGVQRREFPFEEQGRAVVLAARAARDTRPGLVILLSGHAMAEDEILRQWQSGLISHNLVLVMPKNPENQALTPDDIPLILASLQMTALEFRADLRRVVVAAEHSDVSLAWQLTTGGPSPIRGIAVMSGWFPVGPVAAADGNGLSVLIPMQGDSAQSSALLKQNADALKKSGFQVLHPSGNEMIDSLLDWTVLLRAL